MAYIVVNYGELETLMDASDVQQLTEKAKFYMLKGLWREMIGYRYNYGKCKYLHDMMRRCHGAACIHMIDFFAKAMGKDNLRKELTEAVDASGRTVMVVAAKHLEGGFVVDIIRKYDLDVSRYSARSGMSVLTYALKRKKYDLVLACMRRVKLAAYTTAEMEFFRRDVALLQKCMNKAPVIDSQIFEVMTQRCGGDGGKDTGAVGVGRIARLIPPLPQPPRCYKNLRLRQLLRHVASQLFFRWKYMLAVTELQDVQILYVEKTDEFPERRPVAFVACTPPNCYQAVREDFKKNSFEEMFCSVYSSSTKGEEMVEVLSQRFVKKLKKRVWLEQQQQQEQQRKQQQQPNKKKKKSNVKKTTHSGAIATAVNSKKGKKSANTNAIKKQQQNIWDFLTGTRKIQSVVYDSTKNTIELPYFAHVDSTCYLVRLKEGSTPFALHAHYILASIAHSIKTEAADTNNVRTTLYGSGRPCSTCVFLLRRYGVDDYNMSPGSVWPEGVCY